VQVVILLGIAFVAGICRSEPGLYRLSWVEEPSTSATICWSLLSGENPVLQYGKVGSSTTKTVPAQTNLCMDLTHCFVRLKNLKPDTAYWFKAGDSEGTGRRLWFRTAPITSKPFSFIAGGDSRLGDRDARQTGNLLVSKLRPLFVLFGGDYVANGDPKKWRKWLDDWQLTISEDGRIYPIVPAYGNHELYDRGILNKIFAAPETSYYSVGVGNNLLRLWVLDSEAKGSAVDAQNRWFNESLTKHTNARWKMTAYHAPMRPTSTSKSNRNWLYDRWANLFFENGINVVFESDQHSVKRTWPIRPDKGPGSDEGFIRDDEKGTVYLGEGTWGAPMRLADNPKPWTRACGKFAQFKWVWVSPKQLQVRSVKLENAKVAASVKDDQPFKEPGGMVFWTPESGKVLYLPIDSSDPNLAKAPLFCIFLDRDSEWVWTEDKETGTCQTTRSFVVKGRSQIKDRVLTEFKLSEGEVFVRLNGREILHKKIVNKDGHSSIKRFTIKLDPALLKEGENAIEVTWKPTGDKKVFDMRIGAWETPQ
jgi:hypothetical protein